MGAATALATAVAPAALLVLVALARPCFRRLLLFAAKEEGNQQQVKSMYPVTQQQLKMTDLCTEIPQKSR